MSSRSLAERGWLVVALGVAIALKMAIVSDLTILIQYNPQDDGLYVVRAYHLLTGGGFGPYDARTLVKLPGMSFWLAGVRLLGLPYLWSVNLLYAAAGCYFLAAALQSGASRPLAFLAFVIYLFNPITMGTEWIRVLREPLSTGLFVVLLAAALFILLRLRERRVPLGHMAVFTVVFAFSLLLREEDVVLYSALVMLGAAAWWTARSEPASRAMTACAISIVIAPLLLASAVNAASREFVERHYGLPLLHDLSEGEFPRLIAAMRSIESKKDNRYVMITRERLAMLLHEVPALVPVIKRLPLPGPNTGSCQWYKVCSEMGNGWMQFWIKDAAWEAGLTPDLPKAQAYFRAVRQDIERACSEGRLKCVPNGSEYLPPFEFRWTRAYLKEMLTLLAMTVAPNPYLSETRPERYEVDASFGRIFQLVTMAHEYDTDAKGASGLPRYASPLAGWRAGIGGVYRILAPIIVLLAAAAMVARVALWRRAPLGPLAVLGGIFATYLAVRVAGLSYVAVYLGHFDSRMVFATHSFILLFGLFVMADVLKAWRTAPSPRPTSG